MSDPKNDDLQDYRKGMPLLLAAFVTSEDINISLNSPTGSPDFSVRTDLPEDMAPLILPAILFEGGAHALAAFLPHVEPGEERAMMESLLATVQKRVESVVAQYLEKEKKEGKDHGNA